MKKLKPFDYVLIAGVIILAVVFVLVLAHKNKIFSKSPVEATKKIAFQVMLRGLTFTDSYVPLQIGDESFITIRNVPYTKLQIVDFAYQPKKIVIPVNDPKQPFAVVDDYSMPYQYDFVVTLVDDAKITKDGPVVGGNKLKIGLPIVLEGFNYRFGGTVANVKILEDKDLAIVKQLLMNAKKEQKARETKDLTKHQALKMDEKE